MDKESLRKQIIEVNKKQLKLAFATQMVIYSGDITFLNSLDNDDLINWLHNLSFVIYDNENTHILSPKVKYNLYEILSIFRDKFKDTDTLNQIGSLILSLNKTGYENYPKMMTDEFTDRVLRMTPLRKLIKIKELNFEYLENNVKISLCEDYSFFTNLMEESEDKFLDTNVGSNWALTNLCNLLSNYSPILKDDELISRITNLLNYNLALPKGEDTPFGTFHDHNKICLKKVKRL